MKIIIELEKETVDDLKLAIEKIQEEIEKRKSSVPESVQSGSDEPDLTAFLLKNKEAMLKNQLKPR